jgi:predicted metal-dependent hydrolase
MTVPVQTSGELLSFRYGDERIKFLRVQRHSASSNSVLIKVQPDCKVIIAAPDSSSDDTVIAAAKKRQRWICQKLTEFREQQAHVVPRSYISGESHFYLGRQYLLKVSVTDKQCAGVKLHRGKLETTVQRKEAADVKEAMTRWYRERAKSVFQARLSAVMEQALWVERLPPLQIRAMKTQWGSCSPSGRILLNLHLVKAPRECIDYVILHELCHLAEHNHSKRFYQLMKRVMPKWEATKFRLDGLAAKLLN